jgi:predicted DNA-binding transcriptional regulator AlpA
LLTLLHTSRKFLMQKPEAAAPTCPATTEWVRVADAAKILGVSCSLFHKLMLRGEGPPSIKLGASRLFSVTTLRAWMKEREA